MRCVIDSKRCEQQSNATHHETHAMPTQKKVTPAHARKVMRDRGHSYRSAAREMGVNFSHLYRVLNGKRTSDTLTRRVTEIPQRKGGAA